MYLQANSCHQKSSINGIQKGVALRLRRICSTDMEYDNKSREYMAYLVARGHDPITVQQAFADVGTVIRTDARKKVTKKRTPGNIIFSTKFNPRGPNIKSIVRKHIHLLNDSPILQNVFPNGISVTYKRERNLKELLTRADPYNIKDDLTNKTEHGYKRCAQRKCDSCDNYVMEQTSIISNATGIRYSILRDSTCTTPFVIYCALCTKCNFQGVGSTVEWKPRLRNYKSHIKQKVSSCRIVRHYTQVCVDNNNPFGHLRFVIIDKLNNTDGLNSDQIDDLLLIKEKFWIGSLVTQHQGMNGTHDWNRTRRNDKINK